MAPQATDKSKRKIERLVDVDVSHVSLVDSPANRTPFKAIKRDETATPKGARPMNITLKNLLGSRPAQVTSVMAASAAQATAVAKALMEGEGVLSEKDGVFTVQKSGTEPSADDRVIHMGKAAGVAYTVSGLKKELALYDMPGESFDEALQQEGFVPGLYIGMDALHTAIRNHAMAEDTNSADVFKAKVAKEIEAFSNYVDSMIGALPEKAFKFEKAFLSVMTPNDIAANRPTEGGFNSEVYDAIFGTPEEQAAAQAAADPDAKPAEAAQEAAPVADAPKAPKDGEATPVAAPVAAEAAPVADAPKAEAAPANLEELPKATPEAAPVDHSAALAEALGDLTKNIGKSIADAVAPINEQMAKQDKAIASLSKALSSSVASTPDEDDDPTIIEFSKGAGTSGGDIPLMDTAYGARKRQG